MIQIGKTNLLRVCRLAGKHVYLDGGAFGEIALIDDHRCERVELDQNLSVFIYHDTHSQLVATVAQPSVEVGQCAFLTVVSLTPVGAFLDWGLAKDLLLPFGQQRQSVKEGQRVLVRVMLDKYSQRVIASTRIDAYIEEQSTDFSSGQAVELLITGTTQMGIKAIVNNTHWGILYANEVFQPLVPGQRIGGFIKKIRKDRKIDLSLYPPGYAGVAKVCEQIIDRLNEHEGYLMLTDKSSPEAIYSVFKVSKKIYKKAIGALYKQRRIVIEPRGIRLI